MKVRELTLTNFRGFAGEQRFQLSDRFTVIAGINGRGKSSLLDGLALLLARLLGSLGLATGRGRAVSSSDVHLGQFEAALSMRLLAAGIPLNYDIAFNRRPQSTRARPVPPAVREQIRKKYGDPKREGDEAPVAVYFTTDRAAFRLPRVLTTDLPTAPYLANHGALTNRMVDFSDLMSRYRLWGREGRRNVLEAFERVLRVFFRDISGISIEPRPIITDEQRVYLDTLSRGERSFTRFTVSKAGGRLAVQQLSDGERAFIAVLGDLVRRLALANPELGDPLQGHGVVLIDELELHLHPRWQREVVEKLRTTFPNIQFIATTHSPFIIQSLRPGELITLDPEEFGEYANRSVEDIAEHVMGVEVPQKSERYLEMMRTAEEYYRLLREAPDNAKEAEERLAELAVRFSDDPAYQAQLRLERAVRTGGDDAAG
jgi:predicted ATPase